MSDYGVKFSDVLGLFDPKLGGVEAHCYGKLVKHANSLGVKDYQKFRISVSRFYKLTESEFYSIYLLCLEKKYHHALMNFFCDCMKSVYVGNLSLDTHQRFIVARGDVERGLITSLDELPTSLGVLLRAWQKMLKAMEGGCLERAYRRCVKLYTALCAYDMQFPECHRMRVNEKLRDCLHLVECQEMRLYAGSLGIGDDGVIRKWQTNPFTAYNTELTRMLKDGFDKFVYK